MLLITSTPIQLKLNRIMNNLIETLFNKKQSCILLVEILFIKITNFKQVILNTFSHQYTNSFRYFHIKLPFVGDDY